MRTGSMVSSNACQERSARFRKEWLNQVMMLNTAQPMMIQTTPSQIHQLAVWLPWLCRSVMYAGWPLESLTSAHRGARYSLMAMAVNKVTTRINLRSTRTQAEDAHSGAEHCPVLLKCRSRGMWLACRGTLGNWLHRAAGIHTLLGVRQGVDPVEPDPPGVDVRCGSSHKASVSCAPCIKLCRDAHICLCMC